MSEYDDLDLGQRGETEQQDNANAPPDDPQPRGGAKPQTSKELSCLPAIIPPPRNAERTDQRRAQRSGWFSRSGTALAAAAAFAAFGAGAGALVINDHRHEAALIAQHAHQTESLARTVDALAARLSAIDSAKAHDELIELRRSVGEIRSSSASSQELSAALAQLSQRVERLDREESARVRQARRAFRPRSRRGSRRIVSPHRKTREEGRRGRFSASIPAPEPAPATEAARRSAKVRRECLDGDDRFDRKAATPAAPVCRARSSRRCRSDRGPRRRVRSPAWRCPSWRGTRGAHRARGRQLGRADGSGPDRSGRTALLICGRAPAHLPIDRDWRWRPANSPGLWP